MGTFHVATLSPTKAEMLAAWLPSQPWAGPGPYELIGAYRVDDPEGKVGIEAHLVRAGDAVLHVPLSYRDEPLDDEHGLLGEMHHSALGTRWVYDGVVDPLVPMMLAAAAMTGQGEALGMAKWDDRWYVAPSAVRIHGGGWSLERVPLDAFVLLDPLAAPAVLRNERFELTVARRLQPGARPAMGLAVTWAGQADPLVVATVVELAS